MSILEPLPTDDILQLKRNALGTDERLKLHALRVLVDLGTPAACEALIELQRARAEDKGFIDAILKVADIAQRDTTSHILVPWLQEHLATMPRAVVALARLSPHDSGMLTTVKNWLYGSDASRRNLGLEALRYAKVPNVVPLLIDLYESSKPKRYDLIDLMLRTGDPSCLPFLDSLYRKMECRTRILHSLHFLPAEAIEPLLLEALASHDPFIQLEAIDACSRAKLKAATKALSALLDRQELKFHRLPSGQFVSKDREGSSRVLNPRTSSSRFDAPAAPLEGYPD